MENENKSPLDMSDFSAWQKIYRPEECSNANNDPEVTMQQNTSTQVDNSLSSSLIENKTPTSEALDIYIASNPTNTTIQCNAPVAEMPQCPAAQDEVDTTPIGGDTFGLKRKNTLKLDDTSKMKKISSTAEDKKNVHLRKNIRDVMNETNLDTTTLKAQREESERLARVADQQKSMREIHKQVVHKQFFRILQLDDTEPLVNDSVMSHTDETPIGIPDDESPSVTCDETNSSLSCGIEDVLAKEAGNEQPSEVVTIDDSSDDDCILLSEEEEDEEEDFNEAEDAHNSGMHVKDAYNIPDEIGRVVVNIAHPEGEETLYLAPQIAKVIKPHQIGGVRFLYDNIIESTRRFKKSSGFGCILAHSMGLGKTLQVVSFCDIFLRHTSAKTVLCVMPINTLQNWLSEFNMWIPRHSTDENVRARNFDIYVLNDQQKTLTARSKVIFNWAQEGGVLLIGYELFRLLALKLANTRKRKGKNMASNYGVESSNDLINTVYEALVKPGPDLVICDEGHRIKNSHAGISLALKQIRTRRRIVLTGYPLQNNLLEYWCMVDFVRPNYLGTRTEFCNMFERPIQNGQCVDSTPDDIKLMRYRAHVLHSLLLGFVQRRSHLVLQCTLPEKLEYVILVRMTSFQRKLYDTFMTDVVRKKAFPNPLKAFAVCCKIWNHPDVLYNFLKECETDLDLEIDDEPPKVTAGSVVDSTLTPDNFAKPSVPTVPPNPSSLQTCSPSNLKEPNYSDKSCSSHYFGEKEDQLNNIGAYTSDGKSNYWLDATIPSKPSCVEVAIKHTDAHLAKDFQNITGSSEIVDLDTNEIKTVATNVQSANLQKELDRDNNQHSAESSNPVNIKSPGSIACDMNKKVLKPRRNDEFSCSWAVDLMKNYIAGQISNSPKMEIFFSILKESICMGDRILLFSQSLLTLNLIEGFLKSSHIPGSNTYWLRNFSYFRLDGSTSSQERERLVNEFNANANIKLFLISTRAGSLGINLTGANRVIIFDASWNPCHDTQAVYRIYRYGQTRPCYVYRIVMDKCLEKKIYDRQIKKQGMSDRIVDECNPEAHLSIKEITNLCHDYDSDDENVVEANKESTTPADTQMTNSSSPPSTTSKSTEKEDSKLEMKIHSDLIINMIIDRHKNHITKEPFFHESLLVDRKDRKLSQAEKRQAHRSYELEKKASANQKLTYTAGKPQYKIVNNEGLIVSRPVASIRPMQMKKPNTLSGGRAARWIPAEVWQRQGMTAQEMTLPLDVVIPTNSSDKANIILKAGQRVMVLKSAKGIYMQLDSGKIIAIRTTAKVADCDKNNKGDVIDITSDCDSDAPKQPAAEKDASKDKCNDDKMKSIPIKDPKQTVPTIPPAAEKRMPEHHPNIQTQTQQNSEKPQNSHHTHVPREIDYSQQHHQTYKVQSHLPLINEGYYNSMNVQTSAPIPQSIISDTGNGYFPSADIPYSIPPQYYGYYDNKNKHAHPTSNGHLNDYSSHSHINFSQYHSNLHSTPGYNVGSTANQTVYPRQHWSPVANTPSTNESYRQPSFIGNSYPINDWSSQ